MAKRDWIKDVLTDIDSLRSECKGERTQWEADNPVVYGHYMGDRTVIFKSVTTTDKKVESLSQYHMPLVAYQIDTLAAAINNQDVQIRLIPKVDQDAISEEVDKYARTGKAAFDAYRNVIRWDDHISRAIKEAGLFEKCYALPIVDWSTRFPRPTVNLRIFSGWQVYSTPGIEFNRARKVLLEYYADKTDLLAEFPDYADEIEGLPIGQSESNTGAGLGGLKYVG